MKNIVYNTESAIIIINDEGSNIIIEVSMEENIEKVLDYVYDNYRYGTMVEKEEIEKIFEKFPLTIDDKKIIYGELSGLKIKLIESRSQMDIKLSHFLKKFTDYVIDGESLEAWQNKEKINQADSKKIVEIITEKGYLITSTIREEEPKIELEIFDKYDAMNLDLLLIQDDFIDEVNKLEYAVNKENNFIFLDSLKNSKSDFDKIQSMDNLIRANTALVWKIVSHYEKFSTTSFNREDMYQSGMIGLMKAANNFKIDLGNQFSTYAVYWIRQSISRDIVNYSTAIRIPVHMNDKILQMNKYQNNHHSIYGQEISDEDLANLLEIGVSSLKDMKTFKLYANISSLDAPIKEENESTLIDFVSISDFESPEDYCFYVDMQKDIDKILNHCLTSREKKVIELRFGLNDNDENTLEVVGEELGVTRERIRQIEAKALKKLKKYNGKEKLEEYLYVE